MKILILAPADYRVSGGVTLAFTAGSTVSVPRHIAKALVKEGKAEAIPAKRKPAIKGD
jgi:hypothetical protein